MASSRTLVFSAPRHTQAFFEALVADNIDAGRPERAEIVFKRSPRGALHLMRHFRSCVARTGVPGGGRMGL
jgi:hypothetical protein